MSDIEVDMYGGNESVHTCEVAVILFSYKDYILRVLHYFVKMFSNNTDR